jgi:hypothetical protein
MAAHRMQSKIAQRRQRQAAKRLEAARERIRAGFFEDLALLLRENHVTMTAQ